MADPLWLLLLIPPGVAVFLLLRGRSRSFARIAVLSVVSIAWGWAVLDEDRAFNSIDYVVREVPNAWIWRYLTSSQGWNPGVFVFGLALAAARLWPRREPR